MYKIQKNDCGKFEVIEIASELVYGIFDEYKDAQSIYKKLKSSKGFEGFTPKFFLIATNTN